MPYTPAESEHCREQWKAACGHHALAAVCNERLATVCQAVGHRKGWMNPTMIHNALATLGVPVRLTKGLQTQNLCAGLNRVQFEGPWLAEGLRPALAYPYTHWIGQRDGYVLDTLIDPFDWLLRADWAAVVSHGYYTALPRATGWHITHHYQIDP